MSRHLFRYYTRRFFHNGSRSSDVLFILTWLMPISFAHSWVLSRALITLVEFEATKIHHFAYIDNRFTLWSIMVVVFTALLSTFSFKWYYKKMQGIYSAKYSEYNKRLAKCIGDDIMVGFLIAVILSSAVLYIGAKTYWLYVVLLFVKLFVIIPLICVAVNAFINARIGKLELDAVRFSHDDKYNGLN